MIMTSFTEKAYGILKDEIKVEGSFWINNGEKESNPGAKPLGLLPVWYNKDDVPPKDFTDLGCGIGIYKNIIPMEVWDADKAAKICKNLEDKVMKNKHFETLCKMNEKELKAYLVKEHGLIEGKGWAYHKGTFPVLLTAHLDTVHKERCKTIVYDKKDCISSPQGIGGDDRCGVYMIEKIAEQIDCSYIFFEQEEVGSKGAKEWIKTPEAKELIGSFCYIIELDRANKNDAVYYDCDNKLFTNFIDGMKHWKYAYGSWSDISCIAPFLKTAAVNFSCGYYKAHTVTEYVNVKEMEKAIEWVIELLNKTDKEVKYEYVEKKHCNYGLYNYYDDDYGYYNYKNRPQIRVSDDITVHAKVNRLVWNTTTLIGRGKTKKEAFFDLFYNNPDLCFNDIEDVDYI